MNENANTSIEERLAKIESDFARQQDRINVAIFLLASFDVVLLIIHVVTL